jgi:hypothetical protein
MLAAWDAECRHMVGNRAAYQLLGLPAGVNLSKSAPPGQAPGTFRIIRSGEVPAPDLPVQQAAATGRPVRNQEVDVMSEDGTRRSFLGDAVPVFA